MQSAHSRLNGDELDDLVLCSRLLCFFSCIALRSSPFCHSHFLYRLRPEPDLEGRLTALKSNGSDGELQSVTVDLAKLTKSLTDASGSLPSYDQRQCELVSPIDYIHKDLVILNCYRDYGH